MEIPNFDANHGEVLRDEIEYQVRLAILGPDQIPSLGFSFIALLYAVVPKHQQIVVLRLHRADSHSVARRWGRIESRAVSQRQIEEALLKAIPLSEMKENPA